MEGVQTESTGKVFSPEESGEILPIRKHGLDQMEVGASKFCETEQDAKALVAAGHYHAKHHCPGFKLARRKIHGGFRVWRIS